MQDVEGEGEALNIIWSETREKNGCKRVVVIVGGVR